MSGQTACHRRCCCNLIPVAVTPRDAVPYVRLLFPDTSLVVELAHLPTRRNSISARNQLASRGPALSRRQRMQRAAGSTRRQGPSDGRTDGRLGGSVATQDLKKNSDF